MQKLKIEVMKNERLHRYEFDEGTPLVDVYQALDQMRDYVIKKIYETQNNLKEVA